MELPGSLLGAVVGEGEKYFFTVDCPIGVQEHIHICIKRYNKILLFSTCSSQTDTAFRLAKLRGLDLNTFPVFTRNNVNKFQRDMTYVNCNNVIWSTYKRRQGTSIGGQTRRIQYGSYSQRREVEP